jgi:hypothetical protein
MSEGHSAVGAISGFLTEDHRRLERLLDRAGAQAGEIEPISYEQFRAGLLRHIGMEEKILFPAIQRAQHGRIHPTLATPLAQLRLEHGALAALLMPSPTAAVLATIREILERHDEIEERPGGFYALGDEALIKEVEQILSALRAAPAVKLMPHSDSPAVTTTLHRALARAGYRLGGARAEPEEEQV